jgi:hypothetical protein
MEMKRWEIWQNGAIIEMAYAAPTMTECQVKAYLISRGFGEDIELKEGKG